MGMIAEVSPLVLASRNPKKHVEFVALLEGTAIDLLDLSRFPKSPPIEETGTSFAENACLKASQTALATGYWALGDDSGLEVDALGGAPGVYSARYAGPASNDADNNAKLIQTMHGVPPAQRGAQFVCHLALADPTGNVRLQVQRYCRGLILEDHRGTGGFGYDSLFLIPELDQTFGELGLAVKSLFSHRARALRQLVEQIRRSKRETSTKPQ